MNVSEKAVRILKHYEQGPKGGHATHVYICPSGKPTIGWGHVVLPGESFNVPMSLAEADALAFKDLNKFAVKVEVLLKVKPTQDEFDALVLMAYNSGVGKADGIKGDFADSSLLAYYNAGKKQLAGAEFGKWIYGTVKGKKVVLNGLIKRRKSEAELFLTGKVTIY